MVINTLLINRRILLISFWSYADMNTALMRFSEWRENPTAKGKAVTHREIIDTLVLTTGKDYRDQVAGHNIWSGALREMRNSEIEFTAEEQAILDLHDQYLDPDKDCMIIGCVKWDANVVAHELAHAAYYIISEYRKLVDGVLAKLGDLDKMVIHNSLKKDGYHESVFDDETHAYLMGDPEDLIGDIKGAQRAIFLKKWKVLSAELKEIFKQYVGQFIPLKILGSK